MTAEAREQLFDYFAALGISTRTVPYPAHATVAEGMALRGDLPGRFTKNLLLRDRKGNHFLVVAGEDQLLDLKSLPSQVDASGRLSFADPADVRRLLGVEPGALTPFALIHDQTAQVRIVLDTGLLEVDEVNFHPLVNSESTSIRPDELLRFIRATGCEPLLIALP